MKYAQNANEAKALILKYMREGYTARTASEMAGRTEKSYEYYRRSDKEFTKAVAKIRGMIAGADRPTVPNFQRFSEQYFGMKLFRHQLQWYDLLEGNDPRDLHPSQVYEKNGEQLVIINTPPFHAKALALDTRIPTPSGWTTIADLEIGDEVFGGDGAVCRVTAKSPVFRKRTFRVELADGRTVTACEDHQWAVRSRDGHDTVRTTTFLFDHQRAAGRAAYRIPLASPVAYPDAKLPMDPYLLGCWLGDGTSRDGQITGLDEEIFEAFTAQYTPGATAGLTRRFLGLRADLRSLGVLFDKHVPGEYLTGSVEQRLALLQGLMDTDGTVGRLDGRCSFTNTDEHLALAVLELARSLGASARIRSYTNAAGNPTWAVAFMIALPAFRLRRKLDLQRMPTRTHVPLSRIVEIDPVPTQCITVDSPDHLFLCSDYTVTHNSMTISMNYVTWRIVDNPNVRIIIVSKTAQMAKKFLGAVKDRLGSNSRQFAQLKDDYAPVDGFDGNGAIWRQDMIYINPDLRSRGEKDPTVEALGIGQQIYGARADLIILDDCVVSENAHEFEKQIHWIQKEVLSRLERDGKLLVVGTRLMAQDLYSEIRKPVWYASGESPWTYLTQPAVLEDSEDPDDWVTLWPRTNVEPQNLGKGVAPPGEDGMWPMWDGEALSVVRNRMSAENWARVYMQAQVSEAMTFTQAMIDGCTNELRVPGPMVEGRRGHRPLGMAGLYVIAGLDPAPTNYSAAVVLGVDRTSGQRYLLDVWNKYSALPSEIREMVKAWTLRYGIMEWRIEENGLNKYISQDEEIVRWCRARGTQVQGHMTNQNKWDPQFGVATMANLFLGYDRGAALIELPSRRGYSAIQSLVEELLTWYPTPGQKNMPKQDCLMALWFAELRARTISNEWDTTMHMGSSFRTEMDQERQVVVDIDAFLARQHSGESMMTLDEYFGRNPVAQHPGTWR